MAAGNLSQKEQDLLRYFEQFISAHKQERITEVLSMRTRHITVVMEDIHNSYNASAVLRSCECFGVQDIHIIEKQNHFQPSTRVSRGSFRWTDLHFYTGEEEEGPDCFVHLREQGYKIVATTPHTDAYTPANIPLEGKLAFAFGREMTGLSQHVLSHADMHLTIPMYGFTESLNISVSAAILLDKIINRLHQSDLSWRLPIDQQDALRLRWYRTILKHADRIEKEFMNP